MHILRIDLIIINDRPETRAGKRNLSLRIFPLQIPGVHPCSKCILSEIIQPQKRPKSNSSHSAFQCPLLRVKPIREDSFMPGQMQRLILMGIISLLKYRHIISSAFMEIGILLTVHRIDFQSHHFKVFSGDPARLTQISDITFCTALADQYKNFFQSCFGDRSHFQLDFLRGKPCPADMVMAVETTVNAVVFTVIGDIKRRKEIYTVSEVFPGFSPRSLCHLFQERFRGGRQKRCEILRCPCVMGQCSQYVCFCITVIVIAVHGTYHFIHNIRIQSFHTLHIFHMICS